MFYNLHMINPLITINVPQNSNEFLVNHLSLVKITSNGYRGFRNGNYCLKPIYIFCSVTSLFYKEYENMKMHYVTRTFNEII